MCVFVYFHRPSFKACGCCDGWVVNISLWILVYIVLQRLWPRCTAMVQQLSKKDLLKWYSVGCYRCNNNGRFILLLAYCYSYMLSTWSNFNLKLIQIAINYLLYSFFFKIITNLFHGIVGKFPFCNHLDESDLQTWFRAGFFLNWFWWRCQNIIKL